MLSCASLLHIFFKTVIRFMQPWFLPAKLSRIVRWPVTWFSGSGKPEAVAHCSIGNSELWGREDDNVASQCAGNLILRNANRTACCTKNNCTGLRRYRKQQQPQNSNRIWGNNVKIPKLLWNKMKFYVFGIYLNELESLVCSPVYRCVWSITFGSLSGTKLSSLLTWIAALCKCFLILF